MVAQVVHHLLNEWLYLLLYLLFPQWSECAERFRQRTSAFNFFKALKSKLDFSFIFISLFVFTSNITLTFT